MNTRRFFVRNRIPLILTALVVASSVAFTALAAGVAPGYAGTYNLKNVLDYAGGFNLYTLGDSGFSADSQGPVAVAGNLTGDSGIGIYTQNSSGSGKTALVVGGNASFPGSGQIYGAVHTGGTFSGSGMTVQGSVTQNDTSLASTFAAANQKLLANTAALTNLSTGGTQSTSQYGRVELTGTNADLNVFSVSGVSDFGEISIHVPEGSAVVINVTGSPNKDTAGRGIYNFSNGQITFNGAGGSTDQTYSNHILWNFPDAGSVSVKSYSVPGSILAPYAEFTGRNGHISGTLVVKDFINAGSFEEHFYLFDGPSNEGGESGSSSGTSSSDPSSHPSSSSSSTSSSQPSSPSSSTPSSQPSAPSSSTPSSQPSSPNSSIPSSRPSSSSETVVSIPDNSVPLAGTTSSNTSSTGSGVVVTIADNAVPTASNPKTSDRNRWMNIFEIMGVASATLLVVSLVLRRLERKSGKSE